jgi:hypothetical protein
VAAQCFFEFWVEANRTTRAAAEPIGRRPPTRRSASTSYPASAWPLRRSMVSSETGFPSLVGVLLFMGSAFSRQ